MPSWLGQQFAPGCPDSQKGLARINKPWSFKGCPVELGKASSWSRASTAATCRLPLQRKRREKKEGRRAPAAPRSLIHTDREGGALSLRAEWPGPFLFLLFLCESAFGEARLPEHQGRWDNVDANLALWPRCFSETPLFHRSLLGSLYLRAGRRLSASPRCEDTSPRSLEGVYSSVLLLSRLGCEPAPVRLCMHP
ncbi:hypothetical protein SKAU_G00316010 [Synaphobranchus kaupii]|uniref:Uncharacterized protein n=1 Tax=Synaphobranchus kaupii TaxID=118154 RepID=A0A9Q1ESQ6_SYNKA|nr:hypothetical protein SKAU_G00316010 [Synaphobranchus kaupii]